MVIVLKRDASQRDIDYVVRRAASLGLKAHVSAQNGQTLVGLVGDVRGLDLTALKGLRGVEEIRPMTRSFRLASRDFRSRKTVVEVGDVRLGASEVVLMAGPCSVESAEQMRRIAGAVREAGASFLRGGAYKPRSSPYSFRGLAEEGLEILARAREETGLRIVTEVLAPEQVPLVSQYADVLQIGARNMQNYPLLDAVGETTVPVLLKRGMMCTVEELLLSAEYVLSHGNPNVILCERGIRTFETSTRNSLDVSSVPVLGELTHLPVVVDPSHATGKASLVPAVSRAALAAGADGLLIEVHHDPDRAWSDGFQTITTTTFQELVPQLRRIAQVLDRSL